MNHVMLDLETFGLGPTAAIVQIGAVAFDPYSNRLGPGFELVVSLQSSVLAGCTVDPLTAEWWRGQALEAKKAICRDPMDLAQALGELASWWASLGPVEGVWAHGAAFDVPVLEHAYKRVGREVPWSYKAVRDTRTVFWLAELQGWRRVEHPVAHTALADAQAQAADVQSALEWLRRL